MITYILNFVLCSGVLWVVYRLFLAGENMYVFNRIYLLFSIVFSLVVPCITIHVPQKETAAVEQHLNIQNVSGVVTPVAPAIIVPADITPAIAVQPEIAVSRPLFSNGQQALIAGYFVVCAFFLLRFIRNLYLVKRVISRSKISPADGGQLVLIEDEIAPHSFLKYIFVSEDEYTAGKIPPEIICHEQTHIRQLHSLDVLFVELIQILGWFNPILLLYRRSIQLNHEFLADEAVITNYQDTPAYQYLLLDKVIQSNCLALASEFVSYLTIKRRLVMMAKNTTSAEAWVVRLAIIPVIATAFVLFCNKVNAAPVSTTNAKAESLAIRFPEIKYTPKQIAAMDDKHRAEVAYQQTYEGLSKRNLAEQIWNKEISVKIISKCEDDNSNTVGVVANYEGRPLLIETNNGDENVLSDILKPRDEVRLKVFGASYFYRKDRPLEITPDYIEREGVKIFDRQDNQQKPAVKHNYDVVKFPPPIVFADPIKFEDVPSASEDAPQSVMDEYTSIVKKYHLNKWKQNRRMYAKLDQTTRLRMMTLFESMSKSQQDKQPIKFGRLMTVADKLTPTDEQFGRWNNKKYQIWIDGKKQTLAELAKFKPTDFAFYDVNDISSTSSPQKYRVSLLTSANYDRTAEQIKLRHFRPVIYANAH